MKKYFYLLKYELKTLLKDPMGVFILFYPLFMLFLMGYLLPITIEMEASELNGDVYMSLLVGFVSILSIGGFMLGVIMGFSLIENKDEGTLIALNVTPLKIEGYIIFKSIYTYFLAFASNILMIGGLKYIASDKYIIEMGTQTIRLLENISFSQIILFSFVNSFFVISIGILIASIARNKIEGFAFVKTGGIIVMVPALTLFSFFQDYKQYLLGVFPNFWPVKAMMNLAIQSSEPSNLNYIFYLIIGTIYSIFIIFIVSHFFLKKNESR